MIVRHLMPAALLAVATAFAACKDNAQVSGSSGVAQRPQSSATTRPQAVGGTINNAPPQSGYSTVSATSDISTAGGPCFSDSLPAECRNCFQQASSNGTETYELKCTDPVIRPLGGGKCDFTFEGYRSDNITTTAQGATVHATCPCTCQNGFAGNQVETGGIYQTSMTVGGSTGTGTAGNATGFGNQ